MFTYNTTWAIFDGSPIPDPPDPFNVYMLVKFPSTLQPFNPIMTCPPHPPETYGGWLRAWCPSVRPPAGTR